MKTELFAGSFLSRPLAPHLSRLVSDINVSLLCLRYAIRILGYRLSVYVSQCFLVPTNDFGLDAMNNPRERAYHAITHFLFLKFWVFLLNCFFIKILLPFWKAIQVTAIVRVRLCLRLGKEMNSLKFSRWCQAEHIFNCPYLTYAAEISANWQHWNFRVRSCEREREKDGLEYRWDFPFSTVRLYSNSDLPLLRVESWTLILI